MGREEERRGEERSGRGEDSDEDRTRSSPDERRAENRTGARRRGEGWRGSKRRETATEEIIQGQTCRSMHKFYTDMVMDKHTEKLSPV